MSKTLRVGMIGCGEIAYSATAKSVQKAKNAEIVMAMDTVESVAQSFAETYECRATTDVDEVLKSDEVDAVVISAPHFLHEPLTLQAAEAGKHVMCEKPIACTLEQADRMIEACRKANVQLAINLVSRFDAGTLKAKELIEAGTIGKVIGLQFHVMVDKPETYWTGGYSGRVKTDWRLSKEKSGGGVLVMNLIHDFDRFRFMTGLEPVRVSCEYDTFMTDTEVEDYISTIYRFDNGAIATAVASSAARGKASRGNRIVGTHGQILFEKWGVLEVYTTKESDGLTAGEWNEVELERSDSRAYYVERFADAVFNGGENPIPGEEGRKTLEMVVGAYQAGETHQAVTLPLR